MKTENRYNVFNNIHKGLRTMLFDIQQKVQQTDFAEPKAGQVLAELERVLYFYDAHAEHEDEFILSHVLKLDFPLAASFEKEHETDHQLGEDLRNHIQQWKEADYDRERVFHGRQLFYALNEFVAFNLSHMNKEETQLLPMLWDNFSDAEILQMEQQIVSAIAPEVLLEESRWMMRGISNQEIAQWLGGVRVSAPAPVYEAFVEMASQELPHERFASLSL